MIYNNLYVEIVTEVELIKVAQTFRYSSYPTVCDLHRLRVSPGEHHLVIERIVGYFGSIWSSLEEMIDQFLSLIVINFYSSDTRALWSNLQIRHIFVTSPLFSDCHISDTCSNTFLGRHTKTNSRRRRNKITCWCFGMSIFTKSSFNLFFIECLLNMFR